MTPGNNGKEGIKTKVGGVPARLGLRFSEDIEKIKDERLRNGKSKYRISTEKLTNMITRHKNWSEVIKAIINLPQEEVDEYGK